MDGLVGLTCLTVAVDFPVCTCATPETALNNKSLAQVLTTTPDSIHFGASKTHSAYVLGPPTLNPIQPHLTPKLSTSSVSSVLRKAEVDHKSNASRTRARHFGAGEVGWMIGSEENLALALASCA